MDGQQPYIRASGARQATSEALCRPAVARPANDPSCLGRDSMTPQPPCSWFAGSRPPSSTRHPARRDDHHYFFRFKHLRRGSWALRSPVICSLSAVAIRARDSAPRFAQANHLLLGRWGRRAGEQLPKGGHIRRNRRFPAFSLVKRQFSAPGGIRTPALLLRRQLLCPAELRALERNCVRRRSRDGHAKVAVCGP